MPWVIPAIFAYFFLASSSVLDRFLLVGPLPSVLTYAFATGLTSAFSVFLIPFADFHVPSPSTLLVALFAGIFSLFSLISFFEMVRSSNVSRSVPMMGAMLPLFTLALSSLAVPESAIFQLRFLAALVFLALGTIILSFKSNGRTLAFSRRDVSYSALSSFLFAAVTVLTKSVYTSESFLNGLIWINFGTAIFTLMLLFFPETRRTIKSLRSGSIVPRAWLPFLTGKVLGGLGAGLQQYAVFRAERFAHLALINALQGVQYIFILIFVGAISMIKPTLLKEELTAQTLPLRMMGIFFIAIGIYFVLTI